MDGLRWGGTRPKAVAANYNGCMPFSSHPDCEIPARDDISIWRYMDLGKFIWMLEHSALYLCRLGRLDDTYEGALPVCVVPPVTAANAHWYTPSSNYDQTLAERIVSMTRNVIFVNCWHINAYESAAMWKLYGQPQNGLAVRSTFGGLKACFDTYSGRINVGIVRYIDFRSDFVNPYSVISLATTKRKSFEHERELRVLASPDPNDPEIDRQKLERGLCTIESLVIPVDLSKLISSVYVAPDAPRWFGDLVAALMYRYGRPESVVHSDLYSRPML